MEDIPAGSGLLVWYAPFYQPKVQKELQEVGSPHSLVGAMVVTQKVSRGVQPATKKPLVVAPSLTKIVVGQGEVTFTHHSVQQADDDSHFSRPLIYLEDKCSTGILPPRCTQLPESSSTLMLQGTAQTKKYSLGGKTIELYSGQSAQVNLRPSIQLATVSEDLAGPECVVRLTVTAAQESDGDQELLGEDDQELLGEDDQELLGEDDQVLLGEDVPEDLDLVPPSEAEGTRKAHASPTSPNKRKYRQLNEHNAGRFKK